MLKMKKYNLGLNTVGICSQAFIGTLVGDV